MKFKIIPKEIFLHLSFNNLSDDAELCTFNILSKDNIF